MKKILIVSALVILPFGAMADSGGRHRCDTASTPSCVEWAKTIVNTTNISPEVDRNEEIAKEEMKAKIGMLQMQIRNILRMRYNMSLVK